MADTNRVLGMLSERADTFNALGEKKKEEAKNVFSNMKENIDRLEASVIEKIEKIYGENPYATLAARINDGYAYTQEDINNVMAMEFPSISVEQLITPFVADKKSNYLQIIYGKAIQILIVLFVYMTLMWKFPDIQVLLMVLGVIEICTDVREYLYPILKEEYEDKYSSTLKETLAKFKRRINEIGQCRWAGINKLGYLRRFFSYKLE